MRNEGESYTKAVGANIRQRRELYGWTLADLAAKLAQHGHPLGVNALSKIERGERRIDVEDLAAIGAVMAANTWDLVAGLDHPLASEAPDSVLAANTATRWVRTSRQRDRVAVELANLEEDLPALWESVVIFASRSDEALAAAVEALAGLEEAEAAGRLPSDVARHRREG